MEKNKIFSLTLSLRISLNKGAYTIKHFARKKPRRHQYCYLSEVLKPQLCVIHIVCPFCIVFCSAQRHFDEAPSYYCPRILKCGFKLTSHPMRQHGVVGVHEAQVCTFALIHCHVACPASSASGRGGIRACTFWPSIPAANALDAGVLQLFSPRSADQASVSTTRRSSALVRTGAADMRTSFTRRQIHTPDAGVGAVRRRVVKNRDFEGALIVLRGARRQALIQPRHRIVARDDDGHEREPPSSRCHAQCHGCHSVAPPGAVRG